MKLLDLLFEIGEVKNPFNFSFIGIQSYSQFPFKQTGFTNGKFKKAMYDLYIKTDSIQEKRLNVSIDFVEDDGTGYGDIDGLIFVTFSDRNAPDPFATLDFGVKIAQRIMSTIMLIIKDAIFRFEMKGGTVLGIAYHPAGSKKTSTDAKGNIRQKSSGSEQRDKLYDAFLRKSFNISKRDEQTLPEFKIYWIKK